MTEQQIKLYNMKREVYVYPVITKVASNGSHYETHDTENILIVRANTIQEVKDILDKRVNFADKSTRKINGGERILFFGGREYKHSPKVTEVTLIDGTHG